MHRKGLVLVAAAAATWGMSATAAKVLFVRGHVLPATLVSVRLSLSFIMLLAVLVAVRPELLRISRADLLHSAVLGVAGMAMVQYTYFVTINHANVAVAIFLQDLAPFLVAGYELVISRRAPQGRHLTTLALVVPGAFLLLFGLGVNLRVDTTSLLSGLASAGFLAFYTIWAGLRIHRLPPVTMLLYAFGFGTVFWIASTGGRGLSAAASSPWQWPAYLFIASVGTVIPFGLYFYGLRYAPAIDATLALSLEPLVGGLSAAVMLHERISPVQGAGGVLILVALAVLATRSEEKPEQGGFGHGKLAPTPDGVGDQPGFRH